MRSLLIFDRTKSLFIKRIVLVTLVFSTRGRWPRRCSDRFTRIFAEGGIVSFRKGGRLLVVLAAVGMAVGGAEAQQNSQDIVRRAKNKVQAVYPELARKMNITGTVKVEVVVAPNGTVKDAKVIGGHPVLASAALDAVKKWRFEPAAVESSGVVDFKFEPRQ
jgi:TonB family protein